MTSLASTAQPTTHLDTHPCAARACVFATPPDRLMLVARFAVAAVLWPHGAQKALGLFGGYGWSGTMGFFTNTLGLPAAVGAFAIVTEFVAPILLVLGLGTRLAALAIAGVMAGAVIKAGHWHYFFMNWFGNQPNEGLEYFMLMFALLALLLVRGGGAWSIDRRLAGAGGQRCH